MAKTGNRPWISGHYRVSLLPVPELLLREPSHWSNHAAAATWSSPFFRQVPDFGYFPRGRRMTSLTTKPLPECGQKDMGSSSNKSLCFLLFLLFGRYFLISSYVGFLFRQVPSGIFSWLADFLRILRSVQVALVLLWYAREVLCFCCCCRARFVSSSFPRAVDFPFELFLACSRVLPVSFVQKNSFSGIVVFHQMSCLPFLTSRILHPTHVINSPSRWATAHNDIFQS